MERSFSAVLPLKRKVKLDPGELITELRLFVEQSGATVRIDPRMMSQPETRGGGLFGLFSTPSERILFEVDGVRLRVQSFATPFEKRNRIHRFVNPANWTRGLGEFADHRAHIVVHEAGIEGEEGPDAVFDRAAAVTATASVVARLTHPVGAVWMVSNNAVPLSLFRAGMDELSEGRAPLRFWLRWHMIPPDELQEANPGLVTHGLAPFVGREIMSPPTLVESGRLLEIVFALARQMLDDRLAVRERDSVTLEDGTELNIRLRGPGKHSNVPVYEITVPGMEAPPPREAAPDPLTLPADQQPDRKRPTTLKELFGTTEDIDIENLPMPVIPPSPQASAALGATPDADTPPEGAPLDLGQFAPAEAPVPGTPQVPADSPDPAAAPPADPAPDAGQGGPLPLEAFAAPQRGAGPVPEVPAGPGEAPAPGAVLLDGQARPAPPPGAGREDDAAAPGSADAGTPGPADAPPAAGPAARPADPAHEADRGAAAQDGGAPDVVAGAGGPDAAACGTARDTRLGPDPVSRPAADASAAAPESGAGPSRVAAAGEIDAAGPGTDPAVLASSPQEPAHPGRDRESEAPSPDTPLTAGEPAAAEPAPAAPAAGGADDAGRDPSAGALRDPDAMPGSEVREPPAGPMAPDRGTAAAGPDPDGHRKMPGAGDPSPAAGPACRDDVDDASGRPAASVNGARPAGGEDSPAAAVGGTGGWSHPLFRPSPADTAEPDRVGGAEPGGDGAAQEASGPSAAEPDAPGPRRMNGAGSDRAPAPAPQAPPRPAENDRAAAALDAAAGGIEADDPAASEPGLEPRRITADGQSAPEPGRRETGQVRDYPIPGGRRIRVISGGKSTR